MSVIRGVIVPGSIVPGSIARGFRVPGALVVLLLSAGPCLAAAQGPPGAAEPRLTVVTTSAHCDWTWGHSRAWHADRYAEIIRNVLLLMRQYPHYVWQLETENEELAPFLERAAQKWPELVDEFWQRVREGVYERRGGDDDAGQAGAVPEWLGREGVHPEVHAGGDFPVG